MKQAIEEVRRDAIALAARSLLKNGRVRRWGMGLIWIALCALVLYVLLVVYADAIVDSIYANVNPDEIREMPPSVAEIRTAPGQQQILGGRGEGLSCSIPGGLAPMFKFQPVSNQFRQACINHDYCYRHGAATYDYTQLDCDRQLQEDAFRLCRFVYNRPAQHLCQSQARKVLAGVRLGGFGSFRPDATRMSCLDNGPCEFPDPVRASSFFEYEVHPRATGDFVVARVAPVPDHEARGVFRLGIYYFVVRPAAISVTVYGIASSGAPQALPDLSREIRGSKRYLLAPPHVVGDTFYWWRRASLTNTDGNSYTLDPLTATADQWRDVFDNTDKDCPERSCDTEAQQMLPTSEDGSSGMLVGLTTHSCPLADGETSETCLVARVALGAPIQMWPLRSSYFNSLSHQDRYRSLAIAPWLSYDAEGTAMLWLARRDDVGDATASSDITLLGVDLPSATSTTGPIAPRVVRYRGWTEEDDPAVVRGGSNPMLTSFRRDARAPRDPMSVRVHRGDTDDRIGNCANLGGDWLDVPPVFFGTEKDTVVFQRVNLPLGDAPADAPVRIEFVRASLTTEGCNETARVEWILTRDELDRYARGERKSNKAKIGSLLLGQRILANFDEDPRLDVVLTQPYRGNLTLVRMNVL